MGVAKTPYPLSIDVSDSHPLKRKPNKRGFSSAGYRVLSRRQRLSSMTSEQRLTGGGTTGNERLTAATGVLLLVLLAVIGVTILRLGQLLWVHLFVGMLLLPPVLLKLGSTGYRFARYYTANPAYREKG